MDKPKPPKTITTRMLGTGPEVEFVLLTDAIAHGEAMAAWGAAQPRGANSVLVPATELAELRAQVEQYREDAERYRAIEHDFSVMSPDIDGNHYWIWRGRGYRGPNLRAAIDKARKA